MFAAHLDHSHLFNEGPFWSAANRLRAQTSAERLKMKVIMSAES